jgi:hypothetical protein
MAINRTYLDFQIQEAGTTAFLFVDISQYADTPSNPILEVLIPGYGEARTVAIISSQPNVISSNLLQAGCDPFSPAADLPDGLYWITYRISPHAQAYVSKSYLRTTILDYQWENCLLTLNNEPCDQKYERTLKNNMVDFVILRNSAKAEVSKGNTGLALQYYQMAEQIVKRFRPYRQNCC